MSVVSDLAGGLLALFGGFALVRLGMYLIRLYDRSFRRDPKKIMSFDLFSASTFGGWAAAVPIGVVAICFGITAMLIGLLQCGVVFMNVVE